MRRAALTLAALLATATAAAHPLSFGALELRDEADGRVRVTWRFSGTEGRATGAEPVFPAECRAATATDTAAITDGFARSVTLDCGPRGIAGRAVGVRGLEQSGVQVIVRHVSAEGVSEAMLDDARRTWQVPDTRSTRSVFGRYLALGVEHIATGWDHLAFVLGLCLVARAPRRILASVTAFTLGHSATLALAALGVVHAPTRAVEAAIAWSLVVVAREAVVREREGAPRAGAPWAVAALFGLLHGFGFAGALAEVGLPRGAIVAALLAFNVGVELGQVGFVLAGLALALAWRRAGAPPTAARTTLAYAVGVAGACGCVMRVVGIFGR